MSAERDLLARLLAAAVLSQEKGVNVLLYDRACDGKTELCETIATQLGLRLYAADGSRSHTEYEARQRLAHFTLCDKLLAGSPNTFLLFDEAEDLLELPGGSACRGDVLVHRPLLAMAVNEQSLAMPS